MEHAFGLTKQMEGIIGGRKVLRASPAGVIVEDSGMESGEALIPCRALLPKAVLQMTDTAVTYLIVGPEAYLSTDMLRTVQLGTPEEAATFRKELAAKLLAE